MNREWKRTANERKEHEKEPIKENKDGRRSANRKVNKRDYTREENKIKDNGKKVPQNERDRHWNRTHIKDFHRKGLKLDTDLIFSGLVQNFIIQWRSLRKFDRSVFTQLRGLPSVTPVKSACTLFNYSGKEIGQCGITFGIFW